MMRSTASSSTPTAETADKHIVDILIEERAKQLLRDPILWPLIRRFLYPMLKYPEAVALADRVADMGGAQTLDLLCDLLRLDLKIEGIENVPLTGRVILAPNHPTGIVDGIAIYAALRRMRPDICFFANRDAIRIVPRLSELLIPVEWEIDKRSVSKTRDMLRHAREAFDKERCVVIFPSGRLAFWTPWQGLRERPWLPATINLSRKYKAPILPLHVHARNSWMYYFFSLFSSELKVMTLFAEMLNKRGQPYRLRFGSPLPIADLEGDAEAITTKLQDYVENNLGLQKHS